MAISYAEGRIFITADEDDSTHLGKTIIYGVAWSGAANTNALTLQDQDDKDIVRIVAETGNLEHYRCFPQGIPVTQIKTVDLTAGTVIVYI